MIRMRLAMLPFLVALVAAGPNRALAEDPPYPHGSFRADCKICHQGKSWRPANAGPEFDHAKYGFALTGAHAGVACLACHTSLAFDASRGEECKDCHDDVHVGAMGTDCSRCHTTKSFIDRANEIRAHVLTRFPLTGAHLSVDCASCHSSTGSGQLVFTAMSTECFACHRTDFQSTTSPNHAASGFSTDCEGCHTTTAWSGVTRFDHALTGFPLTGAHLTAECAACHGPSSGGSFAAVDPACIACHQADYNGATEPNHVASGFPADCIQCHSTASWSGASFNHNQTGFALTGAHAPLQCMQCHGDGVFMGRDPACVACHQTDYNGASDPNHVTAAFPTDCIQCHSTASWSGASFDHNQTGFALSGAHAPLQCMQCHGDGVYAGREPACVACHQADYNGTTNPNHVASALPTDCIQCHSTASWSGASFDHNQTGFALTGAHAPLQCMQCHGDNVYAGRDPACVACHQADYNGTTNPNHAASGFSTDCVSCHSTTTWQGATFNHDALFFPIYSGKHRDKWNSCADCHTNQSNFQVFTCLSCHPHSDKQKTDGNHQGQNGYLYESNACYNCHPDGRS